MRDLSTYLSWEQVAAIGIDLAVSSLQLGGCDVEHVCDGNTNISSLDREICSTITDRRRRGRGTSSGNAKLLADEKVITRRIYSLKSLFS